MRVDDSQKLKVEGRESWPYRVIGWIIPLDGHMKPNLPAVRQNQVAITAIETGGLLEALLNSNRRSHVDIRVAGAKDLPATVRKINRITGWHRST
jgi:hypothetical protein